MNHDELHELAAAYALDALTPAERDAVEARLGDDPEFRAEVAAHRETAARLGDLTAARPPAELRASIMDEIASTPQAPAVAPTVSLADARARRRRITTALGAAAAVAALVVAAVVIVGRDGSSGVDAVLSAPDAVTTVLESETGSSIQVVWSAERDEAAVVGTGLAAVPDDLAYQLWFLLDAGVSSAGVFTPDADGAVSVVLDVDDLDGAGWAITVEPSGGSPAPTTDIIFSGFIA